LSFVFNYRQFAATNEVKQNREQLLYSFDYEVRTLRVESK